MGDGQDSAKSIEASSNFLLITHHSSLITFLLFTHHCSLVTFLLIMRLELLSEPSRLLNSRRESNQDPRTGPAASFACEAVAEKRKSHAFFFSRDPRGMDARWIALKKNPPLADASGGCAKDYRLGVLRSSILHVALNHSRCS